jgi:hypothetical protein
LYFVQDIPGVPFNSPYLPTGHNIIAAMDWLVSEPNCTLFLHYSGHGGQIEDASGYSHTGLIDSIVPVDFESRGQLGSSLLHEHLVSRMAPGCTLFIVMDCCHSGSAVELPYVYHSSSDGQVSMIDNVKAGARLIAEADALIKGGIGFDKVGEAKHLLAGASSFFHGLKHRDEGEGLGENEYANAYAQERQVVTMFSGCRDDQTSADARIQGAPTGAMTWAFLEIMKSHPSPNYTQVRNLTLNYVICIQGANEF